MVDTNGDHRIDATYGVTNGGDVIRGSDDDDTLVGLDGNDILIEETTNSTL